MSKELIQRQLMELVIDIKMKRSKKLLASYDVSADGNRLFVWTLERDAPFMPFSDGTEWLLDFDRHYDEKAVNDCMTSLACVLTDLEAGV